MAIITINSIFGLVTLFLVLVAIAINLAIILRTDKRLNSCYKCLFVALIVFGMIKIFELLAEFQITTLKLIYYEILEVAFVLLFVFGFWNIYQGIRERLAIPRKPIKLVKKQKLRKKKRTKRK